ncbi:BON domain-containing protein (plasmid) [Candidatus Trichorickettsia mobilis]|uniref:BON domain-containing protein n=1 Tax=Candidatus Trichorickettsia mobilis TaxID=1346319 RepID=UPI002B26141B|nr:BON domain-containing protein [Candidatus Trichorickettsia mobilis]WPY01861.1 BON domain-containing protein [Candidatus Trichorickettsia mobilis]
MVANGGLYTKVMEQLRFEPNIDESNITVSVKDNGIVVLGGKVKSYTEKYLAEQAVEKLEKVRGVANELVVDLASSYKRSDADIAQAALTAFKWSMFIPQEKIKVAVDNGRLTLVGDVEYNYQKVRAEKAVRDLYGVTTVINNIKVKPSISPSEVKDKIIKEFERNARIDANNIKVEVDGSKVTLKGSVQNLDEEREAKIAAWSVNGVSEVIDELTISW